MSRIKGMKRYPQGIKEGIKEKIIAEYHQRKNQQQLSQEYGISRYAIQCWLGTRSEKNYVLK